MLNIIFDKPRYMVRAVGGLVTVLGINFAIIENGPLARTVMIVGALLMVGGFCVELLALATLAFNSSIRAFHNLRLFFVQAGERWGKEAEERERQYQLTAGAASKKETSDVPSLTYHKIDPIPGYEGEMKEPLSVFSQTFPVQAKQSTKADLYYPLKPKPKKRLPFRGGSVAVRAHTRRAPRRRR